MPVRVWEYSYTQAETVNRLKEEQKSLGKPEEVTVEVEVKAAEDHLAYATQIGANANVDIPPDREAMNPGKFERERAARLEMDAVDAPSSSDLLRHFVATADKPADEFLALNNCPADVGRSLALEDSNPDQLVESLINGPPPSHPVPNILVGYPYSQQAAPIAGPPARKLVEIVDMSRAPGDRHVMVYVDEDEVLLQQAAADCSFGNLA